MLVTCTLCYLFIGCLIWAFLYGSEVWEKTVEGGAHASGVVVSASIMLILFWPVAVWAFVRGGQMIERAKRRAF